MVGYEYEYRAAEPFFASEALEEEPEGIVDIGYALVQFRVTGREFVLVLCRDDERVVRREGEQRGEERLRCPGELLAGELQERFVPNAPVTVEITLAVPVFVVFAADEPFDACRAGVCPESHRAVFRPAEECRRIPLPRSMAGNCRLSPSDCGISTNGVRNEGMLPSTEGMACIERVPLAYMRLKQRPPRISESRNGVKPLVSRPA